MSTIRRNQSCVSGTLHAGGFTLLEMLVVVAIIGILASLILSAVAGAKAKAQSLQCTSNLRQLYLGLNQFVAENHEYPLYSNYGFDGGAYPEHSLDWVFAVQRAGISAVSPAGDWSWMTNGVWHCPGAKRPSHVEPPDADAGTHGYGYNGFGLGLPSDGLSFGLGGHYRWVGRNGVPALDPPIPESEVVRPSRMLALGDGLTGWNGVVADGRGEVWRSPAAADRYGSTERAKQRHRGRANVAFCDGHLESLTLNYLFSDTTDAALSMWNRDGNPHRERLAP